MKIGLYFGSFNPIHIGHLIVANTMLQSLQLDEVWFVISPQNPFKESSSLAHENHRLKMVDLSVSDHPNIKSCSIEFDLSKPSYTINTLSALNDKYNNAEFSIIMGSDNLVHFHKWKDYEKILDYCKVNVYARATENAIPERWTNHSRVSINPLPLINISSTFLRKKIKNKESIKYWVRDKVESYINDHFLYE